jgi:predicted restriction endonuclease
MTKLEDFLDSYDNKELSSNIFSRYKEFDYDDNESFQIDLEFLLNNIYNIKIVESKIKRVGQVDFRQLLLERFNNRCIVTGNDCPHELEACHIIPVAINEDYSLENGLLLERNIHNTFDKYYWSINPDTFQIKILNNVNIGSIKKYQNMKLSLHDDMKDYLREHYNIFMSKRN